MSAIDSTSTNESTIESDNSDDDKPPFGYTDEELRERFSIVVFGANKKCKSIHVPDSDSDDPEPKCSRPVRDNNWREQSISSFPEGYFSWCFHCLRRLRDEDDEPIIGNALTDDW